MFLLLLVSFLAGVLTVASPCIFPILPVILSGSALSSSWKKVSIIVGSLGISIFLFTLLLKVSSIFISVPLGFWNGFSALILFGFGLVMLFPSLWDTLSYKLKFYRSEELLQEAQKKEGFWGDVLLGMSLGPVFSSCSPTYALILATIFPQSLGMGIGLLLVYVCGFSLTLFLIGLGGRLVAKRLRFLADPQGWFRKTLGVLLVVVGLLLISGYEKQFEVWLAERGFSGIAGVEQQFIQQMPTISEVKDVQQTSSGTTLKETKKTSSFPFSMTPYRAPELRGLSTWFNSKPLTISELKGKVVLVDFWTFSCINCLRTLPYMRELQSRYGDKGLVIIGVHTPEFAFEKVPENVENALKEKDLKYPVAMDNDYVTWNAFANHYWPAKYLIDAEGMVRYTHFGEGNYAETENAIRALLEERGAAITPMDTAASGEIPDSGIASPEMYFGFEREEYFGGKGSYPFLQGVHSFVFPESLSENTFSFEGDWKVEGERVVLQSGTGKLRIRYRAHKANVVMGGTGATGSIKGYVRLDGRYVGEGTMGRDVRMDLPKPVSLLYVGEEKLYELTNVSGNTEWRTVEIEFVEPGVALYAATFG